MSNQVLTPIRAYPDRIFEGVSNDHAVASHTWSEDGNNTPTVYEIRAAGELILLYAGKGTNNGSAGAVAVHGVDGLEDLVLDAPDGAYGAILVEQKYHKHMAGEHKGKVLISVYDADVQAIELA